MPGRHGGGSLGGGGRSGGGGGFRGGGGFGGGGFRGGGGFGGGGFRGGGFRGPGWGGGFRGGGFRGPGWGGGWGWPIFLGGGGGGGCGLIIGGIVLLIVIGAMFNGFGGYNDYPSTIYTNGNNTTYTQNTGGLENQPAAVQTQTALDLVELHTALDSRIVLWQTQLGNNEEKHIPAGDAGMENDNNVKDVVYGKCGSAFYVFVVDKDIPSDAGDADSSGYAYTTATSPSTCHPTGYLVTDWENDGGGWWFVYLKTL